MATYFVSGHLDLTWEEWVAHYEPRLQPLVQNPENTFVVGDARGADTMAQNYLDENGALFRTTVYHMFDQPRNWVKDMATKGGFTSDEERDAAMTTDSDHDILWVRPGRENSGTAKNASRRLGKQFGKAVTTTMNKDAFTMDALFEAMDKLARETRLQRVVMNPQFFQELKAYDFPVTRIIEDETLGAVEREADRKVFGHWHDMAERAYGHKTMVAAHATKAVGTYTDGTVVTQADVDEGRARRPLTNPCRETGPNGEDLDEQGRQWANQNYERIRPTGQPIRRWQAAERQGIGLTFPQVYPGKYNAPDNEGKAVRVL